MLNNCFRWWRRSPHDGTDASNRNPPGNAPTPNTNPHQSDLRRGPGSDVTHVWHGTCPRLLIISLTIISSHLLSLQARNFYEVHRNSTFAIYPKNVLRVSPFQYSETFEWCRYFLNFFAISILNIANDSN